MMDLDLLIGAAVVAYVLGWRPHHRWLADRATAESPLDILKARYAGARSAPTSITRCASI